MKKVLLSVMLLFTVWHGVNAQVNDTGDKVGIGITPIEKLHINGNGMIQSYSPLLKLRRNTASGGFIQGIQTEFITGTPNYFFGNLHADEWIISKGGHNGQRLLTVKYTGNVGIGTKNPGAKLEVKGETIINGGIGVPSSGTLHIRQKGDSSADGIAITSSYGISHRLWKDSIGNFNIGPTGLPSTIVSTVSGNVGIGTSTPSNKLTVKGFIKAEGSDGRLMLENPSVTTAIYLRNRGGASQRKLEFLYGTSTKMVLDNDGNLGIGITSPDAKLAVNGKIHTKEVKVDLIGWSDFVFKKAYQLPTLEEVEKHIKNNGHLKDIPSAKEVAKNGIYLGEMNAKLLQKIEELTLYTIAQEKKIKQQEQENIEQAKQLKSLKGLSERLALIEQKLKKE